MSTRRRTTTRRRTVRQDHRRGHGHRSRNGSGWITTLVIIAMIVIAAGNDMIQITGK
jgi:hypothetical protein